MAAVQRFNSEVAELLDWERLDELGPGQPNLAQRQPLQELTPARLLAPHAVQDSEMARACLAGLWLHHGFLEESHAISQGLDTIEGSYWHAILHRREPDYENAKYWLRRVGQHPIYDALQVAALRLAPGAEGSAGAAPWSRQAEKWDAFGFVDLCRSARTAGPAERELCQQVQQVEWQLLFTYCFARAGGANK